MIYQHEFDAAKRDLEHKIHNVRGEIESAVRKANSLDQDLTNTKFELEGLREENRLLKNRMEDLEAAMPASTAELLALASGRAAALLALIASQDEAATVRTLEAVASTLHNRTISTEGSPYLTRWYVWPEGPRTAEEDDSEGIDLPFAVFLHKFHRGDVDRDQHNHPWDLSVAIVLAGGYREERGAEVKTFTPGMINVIRADDFHRVDLLNPVMGSWSLFIAGQKTGEWGFKDATTGIVTPWQTYVASKAIK